MPLELSIICDNDLEKCKARARTALSEPGRYAEVTGSSGQEFAIRPYYAKSQKNREIALKLKGKKPWIPGLSQLKQATCDSQESGKGFFARPWIGMVIS